MKHLSPITRPRQMASTGKERPTRSLTHRCDHLASPVRKGEGASVVLMMQPEHHDGRRAHRPLS